MNGMIDFAKNKLRGRVGSFHKGTVSKDFAYAEIFANGHVDLIQTINGLKIRLYL
jgi:hypothetical protein